MLWLRRSERNVDAKNTNQLFTLLPQPLDKDFHSQSPELRTLIASPSVNASIRSVAGVFRKEQCVYSCVHFSFTHGLETSLALANVDHKYCTGLRLHV